MTWLLYGANGYTGTLVARLAAARGERPVLAGRSAGKVGALARELGLQARRFALDDPDAIRRGLDGVSAVAHCAGPFAPTAGPMARACVNAGVHYLDITGEISVFEALRHRHEEARRANIILLPGVGFDVVPSDCLAASLAEEESRTKCERFSRASMPVITRRTSSADSAASTAGLSSARTARQSSPPNDGS